MTSFRCADSLAANGIINFDADAFINGTPPRYVGNPCGQQTYLPGDAPYPALPFASGGAYPYGPAIPNANLHGQPAHDAFKNANEEHSSKDFIPGLVTGGVLVGGACALNKYTNIGEKIKGAIDKLKNKPIKGASPECKADATAAADAAKVAGKTLKEKAAEIAGKAKELFAKLPKNVKIGGAVALVLAGMYAIANSGGKSHGEHEAQAGHSETSPYGPVPTVQHGTLGH